MNNKISIIIPVYNVEKYLKQCIESVMNQTYKQLEIILVDDGSKDMSGSICDEYVKKDDRIKVIHKENGGLSSARNAGIQAATGKYIMFLDSDDFLEEYACEILYNEIESRNLDYVMGNYIYTTSEGKKWEYPMFPVKDSFEVSLQDYKKSFFVMNSVVVNKIFKREFIQKNNFKFVEGAIAEDAIFCSSCYTKSPKSYFLNKIMYNYRQNDTNTSISTNCNKLYFLKLDEAYKLIYHNYKITNNLGFYRFFCARIMPYFLCKIIDTKELKTDDEIIEVIKMFDWYFKQKDTYHIVIINEGLKDIIDDINHKEYNKVLIKIKKMKNYRKTLSSLEKEKMYAVSNEVLIKMLENNKEL